MSGEKCSVVEVEEPETLLDSFITTVSDASAALKSIPGNIDERLKRKIRQQEDNAKNLLLADIAKVTASNAEIIETASEFLTDESIRQSEYSQTELASASLTELNDIHKQLVIESSEIRQMLKKNLISQLNEKTPQLVKNNPNFNNVESVNLNLLLSHCFLEQSIHGKNIRNQAVAERYSNLARKKLEDTFRVHSFLKLTEEVQSVLTEVMEAEDESRCQMNYSKFENVLKKSIASQTSEHTRELEKLATEQAQRKRLMIATVLTKSLVDLGYEVSALEDDFFVKNGRIVARKDEYSDHAVVFTLSKDSKKIISTPIRVVEEAMASVSEDQNKQEKSDDKEFDAHWCNKPQLGKVIENLEASGMQVKFDKTKRTDGLDRIKQSSLPKPERKRASAKKGALRERKH